MIFKKFLGNKFSAKGTSDHVPPNPELAFQIVTQEKVEVRLHFSAPDGDTIFTPKLAWNTEPQPGDTCTIDLPVTIIDSKKLNALTAVELVYANASEMAYPPDFKAHSATITQTKDYWGAVLRQKALAAFEEEE